MNELTKETLDLTHLDSIQRDQSELTITNEIEDFTEPFYGLSETSGVRELLAILWDPKRPDHPAPRKETIDSLLFDDTNSVKAWLSENSLGRFNLDKKDLLGWYESDYPADFYWRKGQWLPPSDPSHDNYYRESDGKLRYLDEDGFITGHDHSHKEAIVKASEDFNFSNSDTNRDGTTSMTELPITIVKPQRSPPFGTNRNVYGSRIPEQSLIVDGVKIPRISEMYIGEPAGENFLAVAIHELAHQLLGAGDMYPGRGSPDPGGPGGRAGSYSIMDRSRWPLHLDPYHKLKLGWLNAKVVKESGWYTLRDVETSGEALILHDPNFGKSEFFIIENRNRGNSFDRWLPSEGLAVWHITESNSISRAQWARRAISLRRANGGNPIDDSLALFDGAIPGTDFDIDDDSSPQDLRFSNARRSGIKIKHIPRADSSMTFYVEVPPKWGSLQATEGKITLLRVHDQGGYGAPESRIESECIVKLTGHPELTFGLNLSGQGYDAVGIELFHFLRTAYISDRKIRIDFERTGTITGKIIRAFLA